MTTTSLDNNFHAYKIVGEVLFRRSGNLSRRIVRCMIVRTRARAALDDTGADVIIPVIVAGYESYVFNPWFRGWTAADNMQPDDFQSGRPIDIAVPVRAFESMLATGRPVDNPFSYPGLHTGEASEPGMQFQSPVAAVLIDRRWVEPRHRN